MRELLSIQILRQLTLLEYLVKNGEATLAEISNATGYATRTLWQDAKQANTYLAPVQIETQQSGIRLVIPQACSVRTIYNKVLCQSKEYNLIEYLFMHEGETLEELAENLYLSLSTLRRMIGQMNKKLERFKIKIVTNPTYITGDELSVSRFYIALFSEKYYDLSDLLSKEECHTMNLLIEKIIKESKVNFTFPDLQRMRIWGYVRLIRMKNNHTINYEKTLWLEYKFLKDKAFLAQFYRTFTINMDDNLLLQMFKVLFGGQYATSYVHLKEIINHGEEQKGIYNKIQEILSNLSAQLDISLQGTEEMQVRLYNILQLSDYRHSIIYNRSRQFLEGFVKENRKIAEIFYEQVSAVLQCSRDNYICDDVMFTLFTEWPELLEKLDSMLPEVKVGILFDSDMKHVELIRKMLKRHAKLKIDVAVPKTFSTFAGQIPGKDIDVLVTDIPGLSAPGIEIVCVQEYPTEKDWQDILLAQERAFSNKMKEFAVE